MVIPALAAPVVAALVAAVGTRMIFAIVANVPEERRDSGFRWGQIGSASLVSLAHGTNDAQKTMGVITLALIAYGSWTDVEAIPFWVKATCALAIAAGTYVGGWRVIRTLGKGLVEISSPQGMAAEAVVGRDHPVLQPSGHGAVHDPRRHRFHHGYGSGPQGGRGALGCRRSDGGRLADHPAGRGHGRRAVLVPGLRPSGDPGASPSSSGCWSLAAAGMFRRSRKTAVNSDNVNAEWEGGVVPADLRAPVKV